MKNRKMAILHFTFFLCCGFILVVRFPNTNLDSDNTLNHLENAIATECGNPTFLLLEL